MVKHTKRAKPGAARGRGDEAPASGGSGGRPGDARGSEAVRRFVERFALTMAASGMPRMAARVFVDVLIAEDGRRTAAELARALRVSPAAVSIAVRYLVQVGLVAKEREPGERTDHYRVYDDLWYEIFGQRDAVLTRWERDLRDGVEALGAGTAASARLDETRRFFEFLRGEIPLMMRKWRKLRAEGAGATTPAKRGK